jgi:rod shape determining protein RodA
MALRPYAAAKRTLSLTDKLGEVNWGLMLLIFLISVAGIAMLYSVAGARFQPWALRQIGHFTLGLIVLLAAAVVDIRVWMSLAYPAYAFALVLLIAVDLVGHVGLGAQRWISIGPLDLQPSELMKIALILAMARFLHGKSIEEVSKPIPLAIGLAMMGIPAIFVVLQPNLGTTLIIVADGCSLLFLAGLSWWWIAPTLAGIAAAVPLAWRFVLHDYQKAGGDLPQSDPALGKGWNIAGQDRHRFGGRGGGTQRDQRLNFLPEKQTDFIWTSICRFDFVGRLALLVLLRW